MEISSASFPAASRIPPTKELQDAINEFQKTLTDDQRSNLNKLRAIPDANAVLVFTSQLDMSTTQRNRPNKGTRLTSVLQFIRESSVIIDTFVSSHPEIAALVWGSVRLTIQVVLNFTSYYERVSDLFMRFAKDCPRFNEYQALFPNSPGLQKAICDFNASIIYCCKHVIEAIHRPWHANLRNAFMQSFQQEFNPDLYKIRTCGLEVKQEIKLAKAKADDQDKRLQQIERKAASEERRKIRHLFSRVESDLNTIKNDQLEQDIRRSEESSRHLLNSLSSYDYLTPFRKACKLRHPRTAEWLFRLTTFTQWEEGISSPWLWCSGKIGSGKTILTASAIEHVFSHERRAKEFVTFFFPHFTDQTPPSAEATLRSIVRQSLDPVNLSSEWKRRLAELNRKPSSELGELTSLLRQTIDQSDIFYIFIDALDEFEPAERRALLSSLVSIGSGSGLRVFLSSRESLSGELRDRIPTINTVLMASAEAKIDIAAFVEETLQEKQQTGDFMVRDQSIIDDIRQALINRADGMFLWVTFQLDEICAQICDDDIRDTIGRLPKSLTETLNRVLYRIIKRGKSSIANKAFQWIAIAKRPLTVDELREAISIDIGQASSKPGRLVNGINQLPMWCENLVRVDEELRTAEFAHKAVYEFIIGGLSGPGFTEFHFKLEDVDHNAGEICVTYLNFSDFVTTVTRRSQPVRADPTIMAYSALKNSWKLPKSISSAIITKKKNAQEERDLVKMLATYNRSDDEEAINKLQDCHPFLKYASIYWISHTTRFRSRTSRTWSIWQQVFTQGHGLAKIPWSSQQEPRALNSNILPWSFANCHFALIRYLGGLGMIDDAEKAEALQRSATEGDMDLVDALLESKCTVEIASSALQAASGGGHIEVVERLFSAGANVNANPNGYNKRTALQAASENGHIETVERLLSAGANINADPANYNGRTALQAASEGGYIEVIERLFSAGANVNAYPADYYGRTALQAASENGHIEIVERLLSAGANINADPADYNGRTALQAASEGGYIEVIERLFSAGANVNAYPADHNGRTALQAASENGHIETVKRLLFAGANVNAYPADYNGRTALHAASGGGHIEVVERLLSAGANVNAGPAYNEQTALQAASENGHIEIVKRLLSAGAKVNAGPAYNEQTALQAASGGGHIEVMERFHVAGTHSS